MKYLLLGLLLPTFAACQVDNDIAGDGDSGSAEARVAAKSGDFCTSTCDRLSQCDVEGLVDEDDCLGECQELFEEEFLHRGELCAQAAERFMSCLSQSSCNDLANDTKRCQPSPSEEAACDVGDEPPPPDDNPPTSIPGGPPLNGEGPVTCGAVEFFGDPAEESFSCESDLQSCSDGRSYAVSCAATTLGPPLCTCSVDGTATASFSLVDLSCPSQNDINLGCGFWIVSLSSSPDPRVPAACQGDAGGGGNGNGNGCMVELSDCGGHAYGLDCVGSGGTERCTCFVDGLPTGSFHDPAGFCPSTGTAEELMRINQGCGWYLTGL